MDCPGLRANNLYDLCYDFLNLTWHQLARTVENDTGFGSEQTIGTNITILVETARLEIRLNVNSGLKEFLIVSWLEIGIVLSHRFYGSQQRVLRW